jgi:putative membrane protein
MGTPDLEGNMMKVVMIALASPLLLAGVAHAAQPDNAFLTEAMKGDNSEIALGKLAEERGGSPKVRAYGKMLVTDHGQHKQTVAALSKAMNVPATDAMTPEAMKTKTKLDSLHGNDFDAAFKKDMVEGHQKVIATYEVQAKSVGHPAVRRLAVQTLPTLRKHLQGAEAL